MSARRTLLPLTLILLLAACQPTPVTPPEPVPTPPPVPSNPPVPSGPSVRTSDLRISELSTSWFSDSAAWVEVYNGTAQPISLKDYALRAYSSQRVAPYNDEFTPRSYPLPDVTVAPGEYLMIGGQGLPSFQNNIRPEAKQIYVHDGDWIPNWYQSGFAELTRAGATVDFIRFGEADAEPLTAAAWTGPNAEAMPAGEERHGRALSRNLTLADTNSAADWTPNLWLTPFGPNNVPQYAADLDLDGLPDTAEADGARYGALDVYALGARAGVRDLFIELDHMPSQDAATTPRQEALDKVVAAFAARGIAVHFDTGSLFGAKYNLGGGNAVPFKACVDLFPSEAQVAGGCADLYTLKATAQSPLRRNVFHYLLFASSRQADGLAGSSGVAEISGNDLVVSLGGWGLDDLTSNRRNALVNIQASTLMHELGHNLGLRHGGFEDGPNFKPNYLSIMNYAYQLNGLPLNPAAQGAEQHWQYNLSRDARQRFGLFGRCDIDNGPCSSAFRLDYSDGSGAVFNENALNERAGLGRGNFNIDWNLNGVIDDAPVKADVTFDTDNAGRPAPAYTTYLRDHDDWGNLNLSFTRYWGGNNPGVTRLNAPSQEEHAHDDHDDAVPLFDAFQSDRQQASVEPRPTPELLADLRDLR
ncbi:hypothetical protein K7W42_07265 [Deinococcus sp. HMF7604]|uniref:hypothetical protein n=1 Tax=Deinococcus betulae TaxID=2873312 RepID=UPI001CCF228B|nr:hypothetical protein [Deinococcus betulae]MBZ9750659.1 hypothetical protein [Deinococcus betulae]